MTDALAPTGERFLPGQMAGEIELEHLHRYRAASELIEGLDVLDIASGEGYGSALLASRARSVVGVDVAREAVEFARGKYARIENLEYREGSCASIPLPDASCDAVVSFETIEHHVQHEEMMSEIKRVLRPGGLLIISSPDKHEYSDVPGYSNPYHVKELYRDEFETLLGRWFAHTRLYGQRAVRASYIDKVDDATGGLDHNVNYRLDAQGLKRAQGSIAPLYFVALASDRPLSRGFPTGTFVNAEEEARLATLQHDFNQRGAELNALHGHIQHMNGEVARRDESLRALESSVQSGRNAALRASQAKSARLASAIEQDYRLLRNALDARDRRIGELSLASRLPAASGGTTQAPTSRSRWSAIKSSLKSRWSRARSPLADTPTLPTEARHEPPPPAADAAELVDGFDREFYLQCYRDVAASGADPYRHYLDHGRAEGRLAAPPKLVITSETGTLLPERRTVLVVSHEASRTGAPILGWNICRELMSGFNVIGLLLGDGEIRPFFAAQCNVLVGPYSRSALGHESMSRVMRELCRRYPIDLAIVNSMESRVVLQPLAEQSVPTVLLVHEFLAYSRPTEEFISALAWASATVFSAGIVRDNALTDRTREAVMRSHLIPQGKSLIPVQTQSDLPTDSSFDRIRRVITAKAPVPGSLIVMGAGTVQYRKGVDLFVATASELKRIAPQVPITLIWIGHGFDPERDLAYSAYLRQQCDFAQLDNFHLMAETANLEAVYALADVFFLPSRLDPLPNVAIDAMTQGLPVLCFDGATGIAEILVKSEQTRTCVLPFANVQAAAEKLLRIQSDDDYRQALSEQCRQLALREFGMPGYVSRLVQIAQAAAVRMEVEQDDIATLSETADFDVDYALAPGSTAVRDDAIRHFVRRWSSGIDLRRPAAGFEPTRYAEMHDLRAGPVNPFAHYIRAGRPSGPWRKPVIDVSLPAPESRNPLRCALHIHAYYVDLLEEIAARLARNTSRFDLYVSVANVDAARRAESLLGGLGRTLQIRSVPNRGRDIAPLLTEFADDLARYDVVGHVHTKASAELKSPEFVQRWSDFLLGTLLGNHSGAIDRILPRFAVEPTLGLVYADDPHIVGWSGNKAHADALAERMGLPALPTEAPGFPVGTMFWARREALAPLFALKLRWDDYPEEPLPYDGTLLHAIERLVPLVVEHSGFGSAVAHVPGLRR